MVSPTRDPNALRNPFESFVGAADSIMQLQRGRDQNALTSYLADNGRAILAGDRNALSGLAGMRGGLEPALNIQGDFEAQNRERVAQFGKMLLTAQTPDDFERVREFTVRSGLARPEEVARYRFEDLPALQDSVRESFQGTEFERLISGLSPELRATATGVKLGLLPSAEGGQKAPAGYQWTPDGRLEFIAGGPADPQQKDALRGNGIAIDTNGDGVPDVSIGGKGAKLTEFGAKATTFSRRMNEARPRVDAAEQALLDAAGGPSVIEVLADRVGPAGNFIKSPEYQAYQTTAREWIAGLLRLDSGAAVPDPEFERYFATYFVAPGDNEKTIALKREARETVARAVSEIVPPEIQAQRAAAGGGGLEALSDDELLRLIGEGQ